MAEETEFAMGATASRVDGPAGTASRVIIDPAIETVTHLVIEPKHWLGVGRLVPLDLVEDTTDGVLLRCTTAQFEELDSAEDTEFVPGTLGYAAYGPEQVVAWPYYGLSGTAMDPGLDPELARTSQTVTYDTIPLGEVEVRRGEPVHATDGGIGHVQGLVIDPRNRHVTHVLLQEGHLWGRKEVAIPIGAVASVKDGIRLSISKREVEDLPTVDIDHPAG